MRKKSSLNKKGQYYKIGRDPAEDLYYLIEQCSSLEEFDENLIRKAFNWCLDAHKDKTRLSGKPYYIHPLSVALTLVWDIPLDDVSIASALLHDVINTSDKYTINEIGRAHV